MRDSIKFGLIGFALAIVFALGWHWRHPGEVQDWLRSLARKSIVADEVIVRQRTAAALPGVDRAVRIRIGDIERGKTADVEIIGPDSVPLVSRKGAQVGDRIAFTHDTKTFEVEVLQYVDVIGPGDSARFRIISLLP